MRSVPGIRFILTALSGLLFAGSAFAISEVEYETAYFQTIVPIIRTAETFTFPTRDGLHLAGVRRVP